ncbi:MAG TPA: hypothetical protein VF765_25930 [Polyangiaceae bacterium]
MGPRRTASGARRKGGILLLVIRESGIRRRFGEILKDNGYLVIEATDWPESIGKALTLAPDAIVLEVTLLAPGATEAARFLRSHERTAQIPVLALTDGSWRPSTLRQMGLDHVLRRPCSQTELLDAVDHLFAVRAGAREKSGS